MFTIILGYRITVYTDQNNIMFDNYTPERVLCWRLMLEKQGPVIKYIKVPDNYAADILSRPQLINSDVTQKASLQENIYPRSIVFIKWTMASSHLYIEGYKHIKGNTKNWQPN